MVETNPEPFKLYTMQPFAFVIVLELKQSCQFVDLICVDAHITYPSSTPVWLASSTGLVIFFGVSTIRSSSHHLLVPSFRRARAAQRAQKFDGVGSTPET